jgi:hypothetical protein
MPVCAVPSVRTRLGEERACHAALDRAYGLAAGAALEALQIARTAGSGRLLGMIVPVAAQLAAYPGVEPVARLQAALGPAETG